MRRAISLTFGIFAALIAGMALSKSPANPRAAIAEQIARQLRGDSTKHSRADIYMAIQPVDIDGDPIADWQVDWKAFGGAWCGTGGCRYQLWHGRAKGAPRRVFDRQMRELSVETRAGRTVFAFDFHGSECGGFGSQACPGEFAWDPAAQAMVLLPTPARRTAVAEPLVFAQ